MRLTTCRPNMALALLVLLGVFSLSAARQPVAVPLPINITLGVVELTSINIQGSLSQAQAQFSAVAIIDYKDAHAQQLTFAVTGEIVLGGTNKVLAFGGTQQGTWQPLPSDQDLVLDMLAIAFNSSTQTAKVSGGTKFGAWSLEVDLDFVAITQPAIGFVVTDASPSFNGLPGAPAHAFDAMNSLLSVGVVLSSYSGHFPFTSGAVVSVTPGINMFAASVFDGVTIQYHGQFSWPQGGSPSLSVTAEAQNFKLGDGIQVTDAKVTAQFPTQPFFAMSADMNWAGATMTLQGSISTSDISFTGTSSGPWIVSNHGGPGSTPVTVTNMFATFDFSFAQAMATGELKGTVQYGATFPPVTGIMKYPADSQSLGCFSLTAIIGNPQTAVSMGQFVDAARGQSGQPVTDITPTQSHGLFNSSLQSITLSTYPNCGALDLEAVVSDTSSSPFGVANLGFTIMGYVPVATALRSFAGSLAEDPSVTIAGTAQMPCSVAMKVLAAAFEQQVHPPLLVPQAHIENTFYKDALSAVQTSVSAMRQQVLASFTEYNIQTDANGVLSSLMTAFSSCGASCGLSPVFYPNATFEWDLHITTQNIKWPLSVPDGLYLSLPLFAVASASFEMTVGESVVVAQKGLNFEAQLTVGQSTGSYLNSLKATMASGCASKVIQINGFFSPDQAANWYLEGALTAGCFNLASDLQLSSTSLRVQSADPQVSFDTQVTLPQTQDLQFQCSATFSSSQGAVTVSMNGASESVYHTKVGADPLDIDAMTVQMTVSSTTYQGSFSGAVTFDKLTEISVSSSFDSTSKDLTFQGTIHEDTPIPFCNVLEHLIGPNYYDEIPVPPAVKARISSISFVGGGFGFSTNPVSFDAQLQVLAFDVVEVGASLSFANGKLAFAVQVTKDIQYNDFKLSNLLANFTLMDTIAMRQPVVIVSNAEGIPLMIPGYEVTYNSAVGFSFAAYLVDYANTTTTKQMSTLGRLLPPGSDVLIQGTVDPALLKFSFEAVENFTQPIPLPVKGLSLNQAMVYIDIAVPTLTLGVGGGLQIVLSSHAQDTLEVDTSLLISTDGSVSLQESLAKPWSEPFGIRGVTIDSESISLSINFASPTPVWFQLQGEISIGPSATGTFVLALESELDLSVAAIVIDLETVNVGQILDAMLANPPGPAGLGWLYEGISFQQVVLSLNPTLQTIDGKYPPGIYFSVQQLDIDNIIKGSALFELDPVAGVEIKTAVDPFTIGSVFSLNSCQMDVQLLVGKPVVVSVSGSMTLLGVTSAAVVSLGPSSFSATFSLSDGPLEVVLASSVESIPPTGGLSSITDFSVTAELNLGQFLAQTIPALAKETQSGLQPQINSVQGHISSTQQDIANLQSEIDQRSKDDTAAKQQAEAAVASAQQAVTEAQTKVDGIQKQIDTAQENLHKCGKFDYGCKAKYEAEIAGYEVEMKTAQAALSVAQDALSAAQAALQKIPDPDVDPQIIEWKAEQVKDEAYLGVLQGELASLQAVDKLASETVEAGAGAFAAKNLDFSESSFIQLQQGQKGSVHVTGTFLGHPVEFDIPAVLVDATQFANDVWTELQKIGQGW